MRDSPDIALGLRAEVTRRMSSPILSQEGFLSIVEAGVLAPSADNRHPVLFDRQDDTIRIWGDDVFLSAPFHRRVLCRIGIGAIAENMRLRAGSLGLETAITWFPDPGKPSLAAELRLTALNGEADALAQAIPLRRTNRRMFRGRRMTDAQRQALSRDAQSVPGTRLIWLDQQSLRHKVLRLVRIAESERFGCQPLHEDLFASIRLDVGWKEAPEEGLAPGSLEVERPLRAAFGALRYWRLMQGLTFLGGHHLLGLRAGDIPCRLAPHVAAIATNLDLERGALAVGRAFERAWLHLTSLGMELQPFAACTLFALEGYEDVRPSVRQDLAEGWADIAPGMLPLIVFRFGRAPSPSLRSGRRKIESYLRS